VSEAAPVRRPARRWLAGGLELAAAAVIGGCAAGLVEGTGLALAAEGTGTGRLVAWGAGSALAAAGAIPLLLALLAAVAAAGRLRLVSDWRRALAAGGAERAVWIWRALLVAAGSLLMAALTFRLAAATYRDYQGREAALFGTFIAVAETALGALLVFAAIAADRQLAPRIRAAPWAARAAGHCSLLFPLLALAALTICVPLALVDVAMPGIHPAISLGAASLVLLVAGLRALRIGRRRRERALAAALALLILAGLAAVPGSPAARLQVVAHGLLGRSAYRTLARSALADRDGDSYPGPALGGADCDEDAPGTSPRSIDVAGNGVDENCTGADADPARATERMAPRPASAPGAARDNVVIVSIDAVRPDHVGAWGYRRPTTPNLDRLAASGTRFAWAFTSVPTTRPAITSLLTGRHPSTFQWIRRLKLRWRESGGVGLAEALAGAGYDTAAIACCDRFAAAEHELAGFHTIDTSPVARLESRAGQANSDLVAEAAVRWLKKHRAGQRPFFLWMHFIDPHAPYQVPPGGTRFGDRNVDLYDAEVSFADRSLGAVLAALDRFALASSTMVVVVSDHGEEFDEHGARFHSRSLYNQVARILFLVRLPGARPQVVTTPVSIVDVMPTVLDLVGVDGPGGMNGRSLAPALRAGSEPPARPVLMEVYPMENIERDLYAVVADRHKVVWDREANAWSLFSLDDPDDREDLAAAEPDRLARMRALLFETVDRELSTAPESRVTARRPLR